MKDWKKVSYLPEKPVETSVGKKIPKAKSLFFSFFEVDSNHEQDVLAGLANANWNGNKVSVELSKPPSSSNDFRKSSKGSWKKKPHTKRKSNSNRRKDGGKRRSGGEGADELFGGY